MTDEFNWGELGEEWWRETGVRLRADERQIKFAATRHRGASQKEAAICAGYGKDGDPIDPKDDGTRRTEGSRVDATTKVRRLLAEAAAESSARGGTEQSEIISDNEALELLSKDVRNSDPLGRSRALDSINKIKERQQKERSEKEDEAAYNPVLTLELIAGFNPYLASELARENGIAWVASPAQTRTIQALKRKLYRKLHAEFGGANGHPEDGPEAEQHTVTAQINGQASPVAEMRNGSHGTET